MGKKLSTDKRPLKLFNLFGIFSIFFFVAFLATYFYSPIIKTSASESDTVSIGAEIEDVVSVALSSHELNFEFTPTPEGVFDSKYVDVSVKTNTFGGYELYFSSIDDDTDMESSSASTVIPSDFSGTVTGTNMAGNKWGYSLDTTSAILDKEYSIIPTLSNRVTLANTSSSTPGTTETKRVYIGVKVNSNLEAGVYEKVLKFTGVAHKSPIYFDGITKMQEMTPTICANATIGDIAYLTDTRDNNVYSVAKLKDGKCWMTSNLRIVDKTIDYTNSDMASGSWTVPASSISGFNINDANNAYLDNNYGGYYAFYTATAGWGTYSVTSGNSPRSICPKNWRLPTGGDGGEFDVLYNNYPSSSEMRNALVNFTLAGRAYFGSMAYQDTDGFYWSSTVGNADYAYYLRLDGSSIYQQVSDKYGGRSVRCIAR